eukprot:EG_transcript_20212
MEPPLTVEDLPAVPFTRPSTLTRVRPASPARNDHPAAPDSRPSTATTLLYSSPHESPINPDGKPGHWLQAPSICLQSSTGADTSPTRGPVNLGLLLSTAHQERVVSPPPDQGSNLSLLVTGFQPSDASPLVKRGEAEVLVIHPLTPDRRSQDDITGLLQEELRVAQAEVQRLQAILQRHEAAGCILSPRPANPPPPRCSPRAPPHPPPRRTLPLPLDLPSPQSLREHIASTPQSAPYPHRGSQASECLVLHPASPVAARRLGAPAAGAADFAPAPPARACFLPQAVRRPPLATPK